jgi:histidine triad (HIT) family protein
MRMIYDPGNIFGKILRGEIPSHAIYEDSDALAIMDVMPMVDGHCLVIPKAASRNLLDADAGTLARVILVVQKVAAAAKAGFGTQGVQIRQYNEEAAGQSVFHLHFHVLPMNSVEDLRPHSGQMADQTLLARHAAMITKAM